MLEIICCNRWFVNWVGRSAHQKPRQQLPHSLKHPQSPCCHACVKLACSVAISLERVKAAKRVCMKGEALRSSAETALLLDRPANSNFIWGICSLVMREKLGGCARGCSLGFNTWFEIVVMRIFLITRPWFPCSMKGKHNVKCL